MRQPALVLALIVITSCSAQSPIVPLPAPQGSFPPPPAPEVPQIAPRVITVGEVVQAAIVGEADSISSDFSLTAPTDGRLFMRVTWDRKYGWLAMVFNGGLFRPNRNQPSSEVSVEGSIDVIAGRTYPVSVWDEASNWGAVIDTPFTLTTWLTRATQQVAGQASLNLKYPADHVTTIGPSVVISGELTSGEDLTIQGRVNGHLMMRDAVLTIGEQAQLQADVRGTRVLVHGQLKGSIVASDRIELAPTAAVEGSLSANRVVLADGSHFNGGIDMDQRTIAARFAQFKASHGGD